MVHRELLAKISDHLDDLKTRDPRKYEQEERQLALQEHRLGFEVAQSPPGIAAYERGNRR